MPQHMAAVRQPHGHVGMGYITDWVNKYKLSHTNLIVTVLITAVGSTSWLI